MSATLRRGGTSTFDHHARLPHLAHERGVEEAEGGRHHVGVDVAEDPAPTGDVVGVAIRVARLAARAQHLLVKHPHAPERPHGFGEAAHAVDHRRHAPNVPWAAAQGRAIASVPVSTR